MRSRLGPGRAQRYPLFDVIRLVAALLVIFSHSFTTTGHKEPIPIHLGKLGVTWGHVGVAIFFVTSGYLVTESWHRRPEGGGYALKRLLRIWPAFLVVILLSVFVVGPIVTDASLQSYFTGGHTWGYLLHNSFMAPIVFTLPGVFRHQPTERRERQPLDPALRGAGLHRAARPGHVAAAAHLGAGRAAGRRPGALQPERGPPHRPARPARQRHVGLRLRAARGVVRGRRSAGGAQTARRSVGTSPRWWRS